MVVSSVWVLTLWITFKAMDGGMTIEAEIQMDPGGNRAVCEDFGVNVSKEMMLHGIPEINEDGEWVTIYPAKVRGRCELE